MNTTETFALSIFCIPQTVISKEATQNAILITPTNRLKPEIHLVQT